MGVVTGSRRQFCDLLFSGQWTIIKVDTSLNPELQGADLSDPEAEPVNLEVDGEQYVYAR